MNYRQGERKRKKWKSFAIAGILLVIFLFVWHPLFKGFSYVGHTVFRPVLVAGYKIGGVFHGTSSFFSTKRSLFLENENLKSQLHEQEARMANYNSLLAENTTLKDTLGRKVNESFILAAILAKPNQSAYDTLVLDIGSDHGLAVDNTVFAKGSIPIGRIAEVYRNTSKVVLFSNSDEKTKVVITKNSTLPEDQTLFMDIVGRGGNNFEMILPRDFSIAKGDQAVLPGITPYVVGVVETIISDPRDPFQKALLVSPVNIQALKFVEVLRSQ